MHFFCWNHPAFYYIVSFPLPFLSELLSMYHWTPFGSMDDQHLTQCCFSLTQVGCRGITLYVYTSYIAPFTLILYPYPLPCTLLPCILYPYLLPLYFTPIIILYSFALSFTPIIYPYLLPCTLLRLSFTPILNLNCSNCGLNWTPFPPFVPMNNE